MAESNILLDLQADLEELNGFYEKCSRPHIKSLLEKEVNRLKDIILIEKNKIVQKTTETQDKKVEDYVHPTENINYLPIKNYSWEQENKTVKVYITLDGIGDLEGKNISCDFQEESFDLKVKDYRKQNLRFAVKKLNGQIDKTQCKYIVKKNSIHITLTKKDSKNWDNLYYKDAPVKFDKPEPNIGAKEDPQESLMNMMKKLYQDGDDEMKKTIAQAWQKSQEEKDKTKI